MTDPTPEPSFVERYMTQARAAWEGKLAELAADPDPAKIRALADSCERHGLSCDAQFRASHAKNPFGDKQVILLEARIRDILRNAETLRAIAALEHSDHRRYRLWIMAGGFLDKPENWPPLYRKIMAGEIKAPWAT